MEFLIAKASETAPAQTIRIESGPVKLSLIPSKIHAKLINVLAVSSAVVSLTVVGTAGYVYVRKDAIIENNQTESTRFSRCWWSTKWSC